MNRIEQKFALLKIIDRAEKQFDALRLERASLTGNKYDAASCLMDFHVKELEAARAELKALDLTQSDGVKVPTYMSIL